MNGRAQAKAYAIDALTAVTTAAEVTREVRRFRWTNAHLLALEAQAMVWSLQDEPGRVAFRKARIAHWRKRYRRFAAKAYALDHVTAWKAGLTGGAP